MASNEEFPSPSGNLPLQLSSKRISKARKSCSGDHRNCSPVSKNHIDDPDGIIVTPSIDSRELDRLKFTNPGLWHPMRNFLRHQGIYHFSYRLNGFPKLVNPVPEITEIAVRTMASNEEFPSPSGNLPLQLSSKRISKARKSCSGDHRNCSPVSKNHIDDPDGIIVTPSIDSRELDRLKFTNPGKQMEELEVGWSEANMTRSVRRQMTVKSGHKSSE
ncbi:unnamed protein product [Schistosoma spindalis]|nr:unnamed protein product [Schistosoma spindale]